MNSAYFPYEFCSHGKEKKQFIYYSLVKQRDDTERKANCIHKITMPFLYNKTKLIYWKWKTSTMKCNIHKLSVLLQVQWMHSCHGNSSFLWAVWLTAFTSFMSPTCKYIYRQLCLCFKMVTWRRLVQCKILRTNISLHFCLV